MPKDDKKNLDDPSTAFPASENTPGQAQSRASYKKLEKLNQSVRLTSPDGTPINGFPWWEMYLELRAKGWPWRKAAFIAWSCIPTYLRIPKTQKELATQVLGMRSDRIVRKWREKYPEIEKEIETCMMQPLRDQLPDVLAAWVGVASSFDPRAHRDRITYLTHVKVYKPPKAGIELSGEDGKPIEIDLAAEYAKDMNEILRMLNPDYDEDDEEENAEEESDEGGS
ncbi:MAG: hypothetical protein JW908_00655 [Anaerolineales bacterium]|nr:hypothetical protein [Anaerolineales bacterium]